MVNVNASSKTLLPGTKQIQANFDALKKSVRNQTRREFRQVLKPLVTDMRAAAPVRTGKLRSSVKSFTSSQLDVGVRWGGKASAGSVRKFLAEYGEPGARGGTKLTQGRIEEAYYLHAVAKGHHGIPPNKWAGQTIYKHMRRLNGELADVIKRMRKDFNAGRKIRNLWK